MKLENIELSFDNFASEMSKLKNQKHFDYHRYDELKMAIENYIMYYNTKRIKEKLNWLSPVDYRLATTAA